jgi:class 3 adenylate cyclase/TolB-like protein/ketosteroid isomerase-like protein
MDRPYSASNGPHRARPRGVLAADLTGIRRLVRDDETRAVGLLMRIRGVFTSVVPRHGGTLDVLAGDRFVAVFDDVLEAVRAAVAIQTELAGAAGPAGDPVLIRMGVHVGDVVRFGTEVGGDSVRVAVALQALARPGGIVLSEDVHRTVGEKSVMPARDMGVRVLREIGERMRVYELHVEDAAAGHRVPGSARSLRSVALAGVGIVLVAALAALGHRLARQPGILGVAPLPVMVGEGAATPAPGTLVTVGVTGVSSHGDVPAWMRDNTRDGLNTLLSKVGRLRVFSREKIDFLRERRGLSEIEVAETLGIQKMISGSVVLDGGDVILEARVVDISSGILDASERTRGRPDDLIELQNQLAAALLGALGVRLSSDEQAQLFAQRTKETLDGYRRLADTFGEAPGPSPAGSGAERTSWLGGPRAAWAEAAPEESAIRTLPEAYRAALEHEDVDAVAGTHLELNADQRAGFERYFASADGLTVELNDVDVLVEGDEALVTFTRRDVFRDHASGRAVQLEVRLSSVVVQRDGRWLLRGVKRS